WRKLHRHFVARYNPNEMLAHFARDMGKDIASAGEIDTKHRARQDVGHSAFGDDLLFLRHRAANIRGNACGSRLAQARSGGRSFVRGRDADSMVGVTDFGGTGPARPLANILEAPDVSTTRRSCEAHPRL